ncbi:RNA-binding domain-containing protein [Clostridium sp. ZBS12]|uniref:RNA-binding domain-containing protein n=1 Tax=Clostridium sp. ZBS12 TaxID=2949972 RepID=UPI002079C559|nr:RNA-binding domain-containing protein [Clostridium sp. ZBS12]
MELSKVDIMHILSNNIVENLICREFELRPGELAKYICGLANKDGGYIFIGVENDNRVLKTVGFLRTFDMNSIMNSVNKKLSGKYQIIYQYIDLLEKNIFVIKVEKAEQRILADDMHYIYRHNGVDMRVQKVIDKPSTLFISYSECDTPIVDIIEKSITDKLKDKIKIDRYTKLKYKDSFKKFMDTIQDHNFVLAIVSDTYLKSQACMYEVGETLKDHHYKDKLLFVVLSENERKYYVDNTPEKIGADIYNGAQSRLEYVGFWKEKYDKLNELINKIGDHEATSSADKDLKILGQIYRNDMGEFLEFLSDENGKSFEKLFKNNFKDIIDWINKGINYSKEKDSVLI